MMKYLLTVMALCDINVHAFLPQVLISLLHQLRLSKWQN